MARTVLAAALALFAATMLLGQLPGAHCDALSDALEKARQAQAQCVPALPQPGSPPARACARRTRLRGAKDTCCALTLTDAASHRIILHRRNVQGGAGGAGT
jgi:hypothetical protein